MKGFRITFVFSYKRSQAPSIKFAVINPHEFFLMKINVLSCLGGHFDFVTLPHKTLKNAFCGEGCHRLVNGHLTVSFSDSILIPWNLGFSSVAHFHIENLLLVDFNELTCEKDFSLKNSPHLEKSNRQHTVLVWFELNEVEEIVS